MRDWWLWIVLVLIVLKLGLAKVEAQDLDSPLSAGYVEWWDSDRRRAWRAAKGLPVSPVPVRPETVAFRPEPMPGAEVDFDAAMRRMEAERAQRGKVLDLYQIAARLAPGTCKVYPLDSTEMLIVAKRFWPEDLALYGEIGRRHFIRQHCPKGVVDQLEST